jgi:hypothetical protein
LDRAAKEIRSLLSSASRIDATGAVFDVPAFVFLGKIKRLSVIGNGAVPPAGFSGGRGLPALAIVTIAATALVNSNSLELPILVDPIDWHLPRAI